MPAPAALRAFIAVELPAGLRDQLAQVIARLGQLLPAGVRWVRPEGIHLTLKFLGDTPLAQINQVKSVIVAAALEVAPFECRVEGLGCFPDQSRPRVVWVGLHEPSGALHQLQQAIEAGTARLGYAREAANRGFHPHLTLGRVGREVRGSQARAVGDIVCAAGASDLGAFRADVVTLMRSSLQPGGAVYSRLYEARLGEASS